jgi:hypothetical protein
MTDNFNGLIGYYKDEKTNTELLKIRNSRFVYFVDLYRSNFISEVQDFEGPFKEQRVVEHYTENKMRFNLEKLYRENDKYVLSDVLDLSTECGLEWWSTEPPMKKARNHIEDEIEDDIVSVSEPYGDPSKLLDDIFVKAYSEYKKGYQLELFYKENDIHVDVIDLSTECGLEDDNSDIYSVADNELSKLLYDVYVEHYYHPENIYKENDIHVDIIDLNTKCGLEDDNSFYSDADNELSKLLDDVYKSSRNKIQS